MDETQDAGRSAGGDGHASRPSRRAVLVGGAAALVVGGGVGVVAGFVRDAGTGSASDRAALPAALRDAIGDERTVLAGARSFARSSPAHDDGRADVAALLVRDHEAHLAALLAAAQQYASSPHSASTPTGSSDPTPSDPTPSDPTPSGPASSGPASSGPASSAPVDRAAQRARERAAAGRAAQRAGQLTGAPAALLASISSCEATHAVLLEPR